MLSVIICDDDPKWRKRMETAIMDYVAAKDYDMTLALSAGNPEEVLRYLERHPLQKGLYILDVDLKHEMNGIALAAKIREKDLYGTIVFVTIHAELSYLTFRYKVEAMDYIIKDAPGSIRAEVEECIDLAYRRYVDDNVSKKDKVYQVKAGSQVRNIPFGDILFFESHPTTPGKIILRTKDSRLEHYGTLRDAENIDPRFYRCHKSFVVNVDNIQSVDKSKHEIVMQGGGTIFVTSRKITELLRRMAE